MNRNVIAPFLFSAGMSILLSGILGRMLSKNFNWLCTGCIGYMALFFFGLAVFLWESRRQ